ncbi:MAG: hypothetical protein PF961_15900 [Planctomycetota bacterium]|jgi:hypothetical protein|nr:hypothetical protein [Planctomycetota bacterium]
MIARDTKQLVYWVLSWADGQVATLAGRKKMRCGAGDVEGVAIRVNGRYDVGTILIGDDHLAVIDLKPKRRGDSSAYRRKLMRFSDLHDGMFQLEEVKLYMRV